MLQFYFCYLDSEGETPVKLPSILMTSSVLCNNCLYSFNRQRIGGDNPGRLFDLAFHIVIEHNYRAYSKILNYRAAFPIAIYTIIE